MAAISTEKTNKPHFEAALQLRGFPPGTTALLPCPTPCRCGCTPPPYLVEGKCAGCGTALAVPELARHLPKLTLACWACLRGAFEDAKKLAGSVQ